MERIQGIIGIKSKMSNFNADFEKLPRTNSIGEFYGTDKAIKFLYRDLMDSNGNKILMKKSLKAVEDKNSKGLVIPRTLPERYEQLFGTSHKDDSSVDILKNIFKCDDVRFFGATFAEANIAITGAVQFGMGFNVFEDVELANLKITSPFRNSSSSSEFAEQTTLGEMIVTEEAHYMYPFTISSKCYRNYIELGILDEGFSRKDYDSFKDISLKCASVYRTGIKNNIENEFALFIEFKDNTLIHGLEDKLVYSNTANGIKIDISEMSEILNQLESSIENVEIYINPKFIELVGSINNKIKIKDITTKKVL